MLGNEDKQILKNPGRVDIAADELLRQPVRGMAGETRCFNHSYRKDHKMASSFMLVRDTLYLPDARTWDKFLTLRDPSLDV
jgi:hypothetical protein